MCEKISKSVKHYSISLIGLTLSTWSAESLYISSHLWPPIWMSNIVQHFPLAIMSNGLVCVIDYYFNQPPPSLKYCCNIFVFYLLWKYSILLYICWGVGCMRVYVGGAICIRPCRTWLSMGINVHLRQASKRYMMVSVSIPGRCMHINSVHF